MTKRHIALLLSLTVTACASTAPQPVNGTPPPEPKNVKEWLVAHPRATKKTIIGVAVGAGLGWARAQLTGGDPLEGALAGAVLGGMAGYAIGKHQDRVFAARDEAVRTAQYDRSQGYVARIEEVTFDPPGPKPGQTVTLYVRYLVIGPDPNETIKVTMFRGLKSGDKYIAGAGPNEFAIPKGGGIVESRVPITLSKKVSRGTYGVEALLEDPAGRFQQVVGTNLFYVTADGSLPHRGAVRVATR